MNQVGIFFKKPCSKDYFDFIIGESFEELQVNYNGQKVENQSENISCFDVEALAKNNEERNKHLDDEFSQEFEGDNDNNSLENSYEFTIDQDENLAGE